MARLLDLWLPARPADSAPAFDAAIEVRNAGAGSLLAASGATLNELAARSEADWLAFVTGSVPDAPRVNRLAESLADHADTAAVLVPMAAHGAFRHAWSRYPPRLAALMHQPEASALVCVRREAITQSGGFAEGPAPLWIWIVQATARGQTIVPHEAGLAAPDLADDAVDDTAAVPPLASDDRPAADHPANQGRVRRDAIHRHWLHRQLQELSPDDLVPRVASRPDAVALLAGVWQWHDGLDESHRLAQSVDGEGRRHAGDYWHAIMHRREPDASNAKYWFRRVGAHPVFEHLTARAAAVLEQSGAAEIQAWARRLGVPERWDPFAFVDLCEQGRRAPDSPLADAARRIQRDEMLLLLDATFTDAAGGA